MRRIVSTVAVLLALAVSHEAVAGATITTAWYSGGGSVDAAAVGDGLVVQGAPNGALAESALRIAAPDSAGLSIVLHVRSSSSVAMDQALVIACRTTASFTAGGAQPLAAAPAADCADAVTGVLSADGTTMTFALGSFAKDGVVSVLLRPGFVSDRPSTVQGSTFRAVFEAPKPEDVTVAAGGAVPPSPPSYPEPTATPLPTSPPIEIGVAPITPPAEAAPAPVAGAPAVTPTTFAPDTSTSVTGSGSGAGWWVLGIGVPIALLAWRPPARLRALRAGGRA